MFYLWQGLWFFYCSLIYYSSSIPDSSETEVFIHIDKILHFLAYAILAILTLLAFRKWPGGFFRRYYFILAMLFCVVYGASDEWHQGFVAGREQDIVDWAVDVVGIGIVGLVYRIRYKKPSS